MSLTHRRAAIPQSSCRCLTPQTVAMMVMVIPAQQDASSLPGGGSAELRLCLLSANKAQLVRGGGGRGEGSGGARRAWPGVLMGLPPRARQLPSPQPAAPCPAEQTGWNGQDRHCRLLRTLRGKGRKRAFSHVGKMPAPTVWGGNPLTRWACAPGLSNSAEPPICRGGTWQQGCEGCVFSASRILIPCPSVVRQCPCIFCPSWCGSRAVSPRSHG